jgi:hypothetical protein
MPAPNLTLCSADSCEPGPLGNIGAGEAFLEFPSSILQKELSVINPLLWESCQLGGNWRLTLFCCSS